MRPARTSLLRALAAGATILLYGFSVACDEQPSGPDARPMLTRPAMQRVARARVVEPGERRIPNPPAVDAWLRAGLADALTMAFDANTDRFLLLESSTSQLLEMAAEAEAGRRLTAERIDPRQFGVRDARGLTIDPASGRLFVLDAGSRIVRIDPTAAMGSQQPLISVIDLAPAGLTRAQGIAFDPVGGYVHVLDHTGKAVHKISGAGEILASWDVAEFGLTDLRGMTFGPTGDATDDPSAMGLFVASSDGIMELQLVEMAAATEPTGTASLVRTTLTSDFSPPSPDPSGVGYATHLGRLVISDGEVNEMNIYAGANVFESTLSGTLARTWTTTSFSTEPTGVAYNPANRHLFISDDDDKTIFEIDPGADGNYGTADDRVTSFATDAFGCTDPEGLAFDPAQGVLYIADGVNAQVFRVSPGANGIFDGVAPAGDDQTTNFDTQAHGLLDPEGIAYDSDFGNVYVVGVPRNLVFHFTPTGSLLRTIDIAIANARKPAGLDYAPNSANASAKSLFVVDRGVDNDSDPNENDGKLYELALPPFSGNALPTVTITGPADGSVFTHGDPVTFTGTASDPEDGDLTVALAWTSSIDGTLGSGASVSASALSVGTHTITASVTDAGGAPASDHITLTVSPVGAAPPLDVRVAASADDAEESASGSVSLNSSDLELVDDGNNQTVGIRFTAVTIPRGATIHGAYVQFQADEKGTTATSLTLAGQATDNAPAFTTGTRNISSRSRTASTASWSPVGWTVVGQAGASQQTPSLTAIIQEIVNRTGWSSGNALAIIITGTGRRTAESFDGLASGAPLLHVEYSTGPNTAPTADNVSISGTAQVGQLLTGNYTYSDAEGDAEGGSTYRWLRNGAAIAGATARTYSLVAADEGAMIAFEVRPAATTGESPGTAVQSAEVGPVAPPPAVSPTLSTLTANPTSMPAGSGVSTITVTVKDEIGAPISGATVVLFASGDGNTLTQPAGPTNSLGVATGSLSSTVTGIKTISATADGTAITQTADVEVREAPPTDLITHTLLTSGSDAVNQKVYTTASISPAPNALITLAVVGHNSSTATPSPAISGGGMTAWTEIATITYDALTQPLKRVTVYRAMSPSPGSGSIAIRFSKSQSNAQWIVSQWGGVDVSGVNGSGAIGQIASTAADAVNGLTVSLSPFGNMNNVAYGVFSVRSSAPAITPGGGFTEIAEHASGEAVPSALQTEWATNDHTIDASWTNLRGAALGIELRANSLTPPPPNTAPTASNVGISGTPRVGQTLTGTYTYSDADGDAEGTSTYQWLRNGTPISGATARTYPLVEADQGAMIGFEVTPVAATGTSPGAPVQSAAVGPVAEAPSISPTLSTVTANPTSISAGSGGSTITVTVRDETGAPMSGVTVTLSASGGANSLTQPSGPTNALGVATGTLSSTLPEMKTVSATANGTAITQTATVEVREAPPTHTITHTLLASGNNVTNQSTYTTASISPAPNTLVTVAVLGHNSSSAAPSPVLSGGGMSAWTEVATVTFDVIGLPLKRMTVFRAMSPSPGSGSITIRFTKSQSNAQWIVSQWGGVDLSGENGSGAIVQTASNASDGSNGLAVALAPFANENNVAFGVFGVRSSVPAVTPGAGFTEVAEEASAESPPSALQAEWMGNNNTISASWTNLRSAVLGIEIRAGAP